MYYQINQDLGKVHNKGDFSESEIYCEGKHLDLEPEEQVFISFICG